MNALALQAALSTTGLSLDELNERQRAARQPSFEALKKHFTTWPTEREVIAATCKHLSDEHQAELMKLAVDAPKKRRRRRSRKS